MQGPKIGLDVRREPNTASAAVHIREDDRRHGPHVKAEAKCTCMHQLLLLTSADKNVNTVQQYNPASAFLHLSSSRCTRLCKQYLLSQLILLLQLLSHFLLLFLPVLVWKESCKCGGVFADACLLCGICRDLGLGGNVGGCIVLRMISCNVLKVCLPLKCAIAASKASQRATW